VLELKHLAMLFETLNENELSNKAFFRRLVEGVEGVLVKEVKSRFNFAKRGEAADTQDAKKAEVDKEEK